MAALLLQPLLLGFGPFYFYPWKSIVNHAAGDTFEVGLKHFKRGHKCTVNLSLHLVCLLIQVSGNFALLHAIDQEVVSLALPALRSVRILSLLSAISWSAYMFTTRCNVLLSAASSAVIFSGYLAAPYITPGRMDAFAVGAFTTALLVSNVITSKRKVPFMGIVKVCSIMAFWMGGWPVAEELFRGTPLAAVMRSNLPLTMGIVAAYIFGLASVTNPLRALVLSSIPLLRLTAAALEGQHPAASRIAFFWSFAFTASLFQGISHRYTREEATLLALEREDEASKLRFEWAHVTFFPNLLLQTVWDALNGPHHSPSAAAAVGEQ